MCPPAMAKTLAMILAGGEGRRLDPLTRERAKPAVPFGGRYRIIDFVLSNFSNSGVLKMKVLTQYKSDSLNKHLSRAWRLTAFLGHYIEAVPAQMRLGPDWYKGSADAIYQNLNLITDEEPDQVFVFGADHVYRMDVRPMLDYHLERNAECTVAAIPVPLEEARDFGVIEVDADGRMIGFQEKPRDPKPMPGDPTRALASMGNYVFATDSLVREIVDDAKKQTDHDFGKNIIAGMFPRARVYVYDFAQNLVPGQTKKEQGYWRDVGTIDAYYNANMDLVEVDPVFSLYNDRWPIFTLSYHLPPAKTVFADAATDRVGHATDSLISEGTILSGAALHRCIVSPKVRVNSYTHIDESILFEGVNVGRHCRIRRTIIDKNVEIPAEMTIGYNAEDDRRRFHVTEGGIVVIPKGMKFT